MFFNIFYFVFIISNYLSYQNTPSMPSSISFLPLPSSFPPSLPPSLPFYLILSSLPFLYIFSFLSLSSVCPPRSTPLHYLSHSLSLSPSLRPSITLFLSLYHICFLLYLPLPLSTIYLSPPLYIPLPHSRHTSLIYLSSSIYLALSTLSFSISHSPSLYRYHLSLPIEPPLPLSTLFSPLL